MSRYEDRVWPEFALRAVVSETDRTPRRPAACGARKERQDGRRGKWRRTRQVGCPMLVFIRKPYSFPGSLAYLPNVDAVEFLLSDLWPRIKSRKPGARLIIAGREPADAVKRAVTRAAKENRSGH